MKKSNPPFVQATKIALLYMLSYTMNKIYQKALVEGTLEKELFGMGKIMTIFAGFKSRH